MPFSFSRAEPDFNHLIPRQGSAKQKVKRLDRLMPNQKSSGRDLIPIIDFLFPFTLLILRFELKQRRISRIWSTKKKKIAAAACWETCFPSWSNMVTAGGEDTYQTLYTKNNNQMKTPHLTPNCMFWQNKLSGNLRQPVSGTNIICDIWLNPPSPENSFIVTWRSDPIYFITTATCRGAVSSTTQGLEISLSWLKSCI